MGAAAEAIVVSSTEEAIEYRRGLDPKDPDQAYKLCSVLAKTGLYAVRSTEEALARMMTGRELGLTAMQSLRGLFVIESKQGAKVGIDATLMHALCLQSPSCEQFLCTSESDTRVEYTIKRKGWSVEQKIVWTIEDAVRAKLLNRGDDGGKDNNWNKYPRQMLHARCKADGARRVFPEKLFGLYTVDELVDNAFIDPTSQSTKPANDADVHNAEKAMDDMERLQQQLLSAIKAASTDEERGQVRAAIKKAVDSASLDGPYADKVKEAYNAKFPPKQGARGKAVHVDAPAVSDFERAATEPPPPEAG